MNKRFTKVSMKKLSILFSAGIALTAFQTKNNPVDAAAGPGTSEQEFQESYTPPEQSEEKQGPGVKLLSEKPKVAEVPTNNQPNRVLTTFNGDTQTQMGFNWYTSDFIENSEVRVSTSKDMSDPMEFNAKPEETINEYAERTEEGYYIYSDLKKDEEGETVTDANGDPIINGYYTDENISSENEDWTSGDAVGHLETTDVQEFSYKAQATDLEPNTDYYYQVGSEETGYSEVGTFKTSGNKEDEFTFVQYTDTQNAYWNENVRNEAAFGANTLDIANQVADPDFVLHTGDVVEIAGLEDEWVDILGQSAKGLAQQPLAIAPGNHDAYTLHEDSRPVPTKFNEHVNVPAANNAIDGGSYYSYDYNNVHFVVANTNDANNPEDAEKAIGEEQMSWIEQDIKKARENGAEWIVLSYHKPLFSRSYHSLEDEDVQAVRDEFMQQIDSLDVDLALQGHDHVNSRTHPLVYEDNFSSGQAGTTETSTNSNGVEFYESPEGTIFVLPNTGGTKEYEDIYSRGLDYIHEVRPDLSWLNQNQLDYWNSLFAYGDQPQNTPRFEESHDNARDSDTQNFAVYTVDDSEMLVEIYQIEGELLKDEERKVEKVHEFGIDKNNQN